MYGSVLSLSLLLVVACTPRAVTPPSRTLVMQSPMMPAVGHQDVQLDASRIGTIWGPELVNGDARLRHVVAPNVALEADAGMLYLTNDGEGGDRSALTGRLGVLVADRTQRIAVGGGVGGGHSEVAGSWGTIDVGGVITGKHAYVRPTLGGTVGYAKPFGDRTFTVAEPDGTTTTLTLPRNLFAQLNIGLELGPRDVAFLVGASVISFWLGESDRPGGPVDDDDGFIAIGIGLRVLAD